MKKHALIILVGVTANRSKRARLNAFFSQAQEYDVFVPLLPQRLGLKYCVEWLRRYVSGTVVPLRYQRIDYLNYISGGLIFRHTIQTYANINTGRLVFIRGPVQENVPAALVTKLGKFLTRLIFGKMVFDLSEANLNSPPLPNAFRERGLIIEKGVSGLARFLGLTSEALPPDAWQPELLLPGATDWRTVPESHDEVYTSTIVLALVLGYFRDGKFPESD